MKIIDIEYEAFLKNVPIEEFENNAIHFVEKYLNLNSKKIGSNQLKKIFFETVSEAHKFLIYSQIEILKFFFLTIIYGINFYNERRFIFIEAELNNIRNTESVRIQNCCDILTQENYLDSIGNPIITD